MTNGSIFYHFVEARRRTPDSLDDFSAWLALFGDSEAAHLESLRSIDLSFMTLAEMRRALVEYLGGTGG